MLFLSFNYGQSQETILCLHGKMASYSDVFQRATLFIDVAATTGNVQLFNHMSCVIGSPSDHPEPYTKALISSSEAGQIDMVHALLSIHSVEQLNETSLSLSPLRSPVGQKYGTSGHAD
jgi:hypothetical protein